VNGITLCIGEHVTEFVIGPLCEKQTDIRASYLQHAEFGWSCNNAQCSRSTKV